MVANVDPLAFALRPPKNETAVEREARIQAEKEALRISEEIDKELDIERVERKKRKAVIKVILLGPSGSGKSTTLKNFQLTFTPKALQAEAATYTALVFLNVVTSVRLLSDLIEEHVRDPEAETLPEELQECATRLEDVVNLESSLTRRFQGSILQPRSFNSTTNAYEISVRSGGLRNILQSFRKQNAGPDTKNEETEDARNVILQRKDDIETLIRNQDVQKLLAARSIQLEHLPGYFLDDLGRITVPDYKPSDDDILRTRIRTVGVTETHFKVESGHEKGQTWIIVDVGGARHQRAAWVPYFDDVNAVIFMAPLGHFNQFLEEEATINCLRDAIELWESIVSQKLLQNAEFILFLNKYDMLEQKVNSGIMFKSFVTSYTGPNDAQSIGHYLRKTFLAIHKMRSPKTRALHCHFTSVTDKSATMALITHLQAAVLQQHLRDMKLL